MTALADHLVAHGLFANTTLADVAITAGQVYKDGNGQIRCAGSPRPVNTDVTDTSQVASAQSEPGGNTRHKGSGSYKW